MSCTLVSMIWGDGDGYGSIGQCRGKSQKKKEDFALAARAAALIGPLQAGYPDFDYLGEVTKGIVEREALLGVSITGMMNNPKIIFNPTIQKKMAAIILEENEKGLSK